MIIGKYKAAHRPTHISSYVSLTEFIARTRELESALGTPITAHYRRGDTWQPVTLKKS